MPGLTVSAQVLLVDDDPIFLARACQALEPMMQVRTSQTGTGALEVLSIWTPDVVVFDLLMGDLDGFSFLEQFASLSRSKRPFILYTTDGRGADTRVRPLPNWHVGTVLRSAPKHELRAAVIQAAQCSDPDYQRLIVT